MNRSYRGQTPLHVGLVKDLKIWLEETKGYRIVGADLPDHQLPTVVENTTKIGDGENKRPDIQAHDDREDVFVRGEAKTGDGDLETQHTRTQFRLFANLQNHGKPSLLYVIVPSSKIEALEKVLAEDGLLGKSNVIPVKSGMYT